MFVAKVIDGQIVDSGNLAQLYPNTSFPKNGASAEWLAGENLQTIKHSLSYDNATQKITKADLYVQDGVVYDVQVVDLSEDELAAKVAAKEAAVRKQRDSLLAETDWTGMSDVTMSAEMTTYRQALRDITSHANFPNLEEADWPTKP